MFDEDWMQARLAALELDVKELQPFPEMPGTDQHFVVGKDKRGVLWTLTAGFLDADEKHVVVAVRYHAPSMHMGGIVHGGAISAIVDAFAAASGVMQLGDFSGVTKEQVVRFRRSLRLETPYLLIARARTSEREPGAADVATSIWDADGRVRIEADTVMVVPKRG